MLILLFSLSAGWLKAPLYAQTKVKLTIKGDKFCINGQAKFLILASYFDALDAAYLQADLDYLQAHDIDGIRIFPNWWGSKTYSGHTLFDSLGHLRPEKLEQLKTVLKAADQHDMVVDISFSRETVKGLDIAHYKKGIISTVKALKGFRNIFFDLQNERNGSPTFLPEKDVIALRKKLKAIQPDIILSASEAYEATPQEYLKFLAETEMDIVNYHEPRAGAWWNRTANCVKQLRKVGKPVYLGEPGRWTPGSSLTAENLITAVRNAKETGAAAWTFHTEAGFNLDHATFKSHLNPKVELAFLDSLPGLLKQEKEKQKIY